MKAGIFNNLLDFLYPRTCEVCGRLLTEGEELLCTYCFMDLPRTGFHRYRDNPVAALFWGRARVEYASSFIYFEKGSRYQELFHRLKYQGRKDIGIELGRLFGRELGDSPFANSDIIVPVPLHPKKEKKRGYNQSEMIARGLGLSLKMDINSHDLIRAVDSGSQTRHGRYERFLNMEGIFQVREASSFMDLSLILVDDVVTTGSTLEACCVPLLNSGAREIMVLTLAMA